MKNLKAFLFIIAKKVIISLSYVCIRLLSFCLLTVHIEMNYLASHPNNDVPTRCNISFVGCHRVILRHCDSLCKYKVDEGSNVGNKSMILAYSF